MERSPFRDKFAVALLVGVLRKRDAGIAALLRAVVYKTVLADVEIARTGATPPFIFASGGDIVLKTVHAREQALPAT